MYAARCGSHLAGLLWRDLSVEGGGVISQGCCRGGGGTCQWAAPRCLRTAAPPSYLCRHGVQRRPLPCRRVRCQGALRQEETPESFRDKAAVSNVCCRIYLAVFGRGCESCAPVVVPAVTIDRVPFAVSLQGRGGCGGLRGRGGRVPGPLGRPRQADAACPLSRLLAAVEGSSSVSGAGSSLGHREGSRGGSREVVGEGVSEGTMNHGGGA